MVWPQIHTAGPELAQRYGVTGIPAAFLIDGRTGTILAADDELRGEKLGATIERHLNAVARPADR